MPLIQRNRQPEREASNRRLQVLDLFLLRNVLLLLPDQRELFRLLHTPNNCPPRRQMADPPISMIEVIVSSRR